MSEIKTTYHGVEVDYDERRNRWVFEIDGNERSAESLENAKKAIDAPERKAKPAFKPIKVLAKLNWQQWSEAEITSIVETPAYGGGAYVWLKKDGKRTKERLDTLREYTPQNKELVNALEVFDAKLNELRKQRDETESKMTKVKL